LTAINILQAALTKSPIRHFLGENSFHQNAKNYEQLPIWKQLPMEAIHHAIETALMFFAKIGAILHLHDFCS